LTVWSELAKLVYYYKYAFDDYVLAGERFRDVAREHILEDVVGGRVLKDQLGRGALNLLRRVGQDVVTGGS